jgi:hypothetical protein
VYNVRGKKLTIAAMTILEAIPKPTYIITKGAKATIGMVVAPTTYGKNPLSKNFE